MTNETLILVDSDVFIGLLIETDAHHRPSNQLFTELSEANVPICTTSAVVAETATVLSHRVGPKLARYFLEEIIDKPGFTVVHITEVLYKAALSLFKAQTKKGTSFTDCANTIVAQQLGLQTIFSFDRAYPKYFGLPLLRPQA